MKICFLGSVVALFLSSLSFAQCPDVPGNLQASFDDDARTILLSWDAVDSVAGYNLFVKYYDKEDFVLWGRAGLIMNNRYTFEVKSDYGQILEFMLCSVQNFPQVERSDYSQHINVMVPSLLIPVVRLNKPIRTKDSVLLTWEYETPIADLTGFVLMINNIPKHIHQTKRAFDLKNFPAGNYTIHILAQTTNGILSPPSARHMVHVN